jgi:phospholipid-translocating ATPase
VIQCGFSESDYQHGCSVDEPEATGGFALIINGHSLVHALHPKLEKMFVEVACQCK